MTVTVNPSYEGTDDYKPEQGARYTREDHAYGAVAGVFTETETLTAVAGCDASRDVTESGNPS